MEKYAITPGDFLKNAGIVGLKYILDCAKAQEGVDFGISEDGQEMWLNYEFRIQNADWTRHVLSGHVCKILEGLLFTRA